LAVAAKTYDLTRIRICIEYIYHPFGGELILENALKLHHAIPDFALHDPALSLIKFPQLEIVFHQNLP